MKRYTCFAALLLTLLLICGAVLAENWADRSIDGLNFQVPSDFRNISDDPGVLFFEENARISISAQKSPLTLAGARTNYKTMYKGGFFTEVTINGREMVVCEPPASLGSSVDCTVIVENDGHTVIFSFYILTDDDNAGWSLINEVIYRIGSGSAKPTQAPQSRFSTPTPSPRKTATPTPKKTATPTPKTANVRVGDIVTFGHYDQDGNTYNGKESIEWDVLEVKNGKALLISSRILDQQVYDFSFETDTDWGISFLRLWMNGSFMSDAFSSSEEAAIIRSNVPYRTASGSTKYYDCYLFALSKAEFNQYFPDEYDGSAKLTLTANINGAMYQTWWLRDMEGKQSAYYIYATGEIGDGSTYMDHRGARPAMWVDLSRANLKKVSTLRALPTMTPSPKPTNTPRPTTRPTATPYYNWGSSSLDLVMLQGGNMAYRHSGQNVSLAFQIKNEAYGKTVKGYTLCVYCTDRYGNRLYPNYTYYYRDISHEIGPRSTVMSKYITVPERESIYYVYCGISSVTFTDGTTQTNDNWDDDALRYYYRGG